MRALRIHDFSVDSIVICVDDDVLAKVLAASRLRPLHLAVGACAGARRGYEGSNDAVCRKGPGRRHVLNVERLF